MLKIVARITVILFFLNTIISETPKGYGWWASDYRVVYTAAVNSNARLKVFKKEQLGYAGKQLMIVAPDTARGFSAALFTFFCLIMNIIIYVFIKSIKLNSD